MSVQELPRILDCDPNDKQIQLVDGSKSEVFTKKQSHR